MNFTLQISGHGNILAVSEFCSLWGVDIMRVYCIYIINKTQYHIYKSACRIKYVHERIKHILLRYVAFFVSSLKLSSKLAFSYF